MRYQLKVIHETSGVREFALDAVDETDAIRQAKAQGFAILAIKRRQSWNHWLKQRGVHFPLTLFSQELLALLDAGLTLVEAMDTLAQKEHRQKSQGILQRVLASLSEGHPLSVALQQFPAHFPPLYVATVRASEKTGDLGRALSRYVAYQIQMDAVRKKIVNASIYPLLLLVAGSLVTLFLVGYVVPRFSMVYDQMGKDLPLFSQWLMRLGQLLREHGLLIFILSALAVTGVASAVTRPAARQRLMQQLWRIPALGNRMKNYQLARFYRTLGMLLQGGTAIIPALRLAEELLQSSLRARLMRAASDIREGLSISQAMERNGLTTPVAARLLAVGERSGKMGEMMDRIAAFYDDEMARWVEWFSKLFEPLLMTFIGLVIGVIVVLMYFPIFELAGSIQ